jgi:hypothetical protein
MNPRTNLVTRAGRPGTHALLSGLLGVCLGACLGACGGGDNAADTEAADGGAGVVSTLLADDGGSMPSAPDTVPADPAARTKAARYASSQQAEQLEHALGEGVLRVTVECCGVDRVDQAIGIAQGMQAAGDLPNSTPVLVRAADLRLGAVAANRLADAGYGQVWLVTR